MCEQLDKASLTSVFRHAELIVSSYVLCLCLLACLQAPGTYDRIVSIEMFEHMKNYAELMRRISTWLRPGGALFVHIFCHKSTAYHFEVWHCNRKSSAAEVKQKSLQLGTTANPEQSRAG